jgi:hypothetical protein
MLLRDALLASIEKKGHTPDETSKPVVAENEVSIYLRPEAKDRYFVWHRIVARVRPGANQVTLGVNSLLVDPERRILPNPVDQGESQQLLGQIFEAMSSRSRNP